MRRRSTLAAGETSSSMLGLMKGVVLPIAATSRRPPGYRGGVRSAVSKTLWLGLWLVVGKERLLDAPGFGRTSPQGRLARLPVGIVLFGIVIGPCCSVIRSGVLGCHGKTTAVRGRGRLRWKRRQESRRVTLLVAGTIGRRTRRGRHRRRIAAVKSAVGRRSSRGRGGGHGSSVRFVQVLDRRLFPRRSRGRPMASTQHGRRLEVANSSAGF